ncbi:MAG: HAD-IA family hydrolase [Gemmatimonadaceae bacterium]|nr:HAD-IA family hydrolase [Gemmatimonadaceae bacterium]
MPRPAILFDLDGTLIDSIDLLVTSMVYAFEGRDVQPPLDEWIAGIGTPLDAMLRTWARDDEDVLALRARYREYQFANHDAKTHAYPGAVDTVRALHAAGYPLAVVTSKLEYGARRSLKWIGVDDCFTAVVGIDATTKHKPEPEPVWHALTLLGDIPPAEALFIGDSTHDMHAGNAAGVATAAALWGPFSRAQLETAHPRYWLNGFDDVRALVDRLAMR